MPEVHKCKRTMFSQDLLLHTEQSALDNSFISTDRERRVSRPSASTNPHCQMSGMAQATLNYLLHLQTRLLAKYYTYLHAKFSLISVEVLSKNYTNNPSNLYEVLTLKKPPLFMQRLKRDW